MPIQWKNFQDTLTNYFSNYLAKSEEKAAAFIADLYQTNILSGNDMMYKNMAIKFNKNALEMSLKNAFTIAKVSNKNSHFSQTIFTGLMGFWAGAELAKTVPPPGSISVITNIVNNPGKKQDLMVINTKKEDMFAKNLCLMFKLHLLTIAGVTTALVPQPSGPPIPVPFNWTGYV